MTDQRTRERGNKIIAQMGGSQRLGICINARNYGISMGGDGAQFKFSGSRKYNHCNIEIIDDTYTMTISKMHEPKLNMKTFEMSELRFTNAKTVDMLMANQLISVFEAITKLYISGIR